jgi:hypothetical protein
VTLQVALPFCVTIFALFCSPPSIHTPHTKQVMVKKNDNAVVDTAMVNADHSCNNNHEGSSNEEEEEFMNSSKFVKSLFSTNDNDDDDKQEIISEHVWTCPASEDIISIIYHLAFLAPGHGDSIVS